jgi:hypothetical protein
VGVAADDLAGRLALALMLNDHPDVIERNQPEGMPLHPARYRLRDDSNSVAQALEASDPRPDQTAILAALERHLGQPPDLYRRSINPDTGDITLAFHFPALAQKHYGLQLEAAAAETGVTIAIAPRPHQGALTDAAHAVVPPGLRVLKTSLHHERETIRLRCAGQADPAAQQAAQEQFYNQTGWHLELETDNGSSTPAAPAARPATTPDMPQHQAIAQVRAALGSESGCYKVSADNQQHILTTRFHFPDVARQRYAELLADLSAQTGWQVEIYPQPHQGELEALARRVLPPDLHLLGAPSLHREAKQVVARCRGRADEPQLAQAAATFAETSGWQLLIRHDD